MSSYDPRELLKKEPNAIREFILLVLAALILTDVIEISTEAIAAWGAVISAGLGLFYVRPASISKASLQELQEPPPPGG